MSRAASSWRLPEPPNVFRSCPISSAPTTELRPQKAAYLQSTETNKDGEPEMTTPFLTLSDLKSEPHPLACLNLTPDQRKAWNEQCASQREKLRDAGIIPNLGDPASQWAIWQYYG